MNSNFAAALKKTEVSSDKKSSKKSSMPVLDSAPDNVKEAVDTINEAKAEKKTAEAKIAAGEAILFDYVKPIQDKDGLAGNFSKSYEVVGNDGSVKYVTMNKFSMHISDKDMLEELLGDKYNDCVEEVESLTAKPEIFTDEELQNEVMKKLGADLFERLFEYKKTLKAKPDMDKKLFDVCKTEEALNDVRVFAKQAKASVK